MGAYLSEPVTTKDSSDEANDNLISGSSSMQGWRISQEDAHNCILNFDENVSFFAVYDGHGGSEVAQYCSLHLPSFLKTVGAYEQKQFEDALKRAFIGFDATLLEEKVIEVLKQLSDKANCEEEAEEDEEEEEYDNVEDLCKEAMMPLNDVLQKYRKDLKLAAAANQRVAAVAKEGNCSKPVSPFLKSKRRGPGAADDGSEEAGGSSSSIAGSLSSSLSSSSASAANSAAGGSGSSVPVSSGEADPAGQDTDSKPTVKAGGADAADSTVSSSEERVKEAAAPAQEPSSSSSSTAATVAVAAPSASGSTAAATAEEGSVATSNVVTGASADSGCKKEEQSNEISDTDGIVPVKAAAANAEAAAPSGSSVVAKENCAPDSSSSDGSKQLASSKLNGDVKPSASSGAVSSSSTSGPSGSASSAGQENGVVGSASCDSGAGSKKTGGATASSGTTKVHSSSTADGAAGAAGKSEPKNGPSSAADVSMNDDDTDDDDEESDSDEEFPHADEPADTSSTEDGEEEPYGEDEDGSEDEDEEGEEEGEYEEEEDFMNEEDAAFMKNISEEPGKESGCTAVVALLHGKDLYVANAGDSRCVVCRNGRALEMSFDHKPEDTIEYERIEKAGGRVTMDGRVNGGLNLSRAIGDHGYKMNKALPAEEQMISALPDIQKITIGPEDDFMVLACDGIWNFMTSDEVVQFVLERIHKPDVKLSQICEELFDNCLAPHTKGDGTGCDNMTAIIVQFKPNFTGSASRKRTASEAVDTAVEDGSGEAAAVSSAVKKVKTDPGATADGASSTTEVETSSNGGTVSGKTVTESTEQGEADASEEMEAAAAVASIDGSSSEAAASSST